MKKLLGKMSLGPDGIWGDVDDYGQQEDEKKLRQSVARQVYSDYLLELSAHHSISVMDREIEKFEFDTQCRSCAGYWWLLGVALEKN